MLKFYPPAQFGVGTCRPQHKITSKQEKPMARYNPSLGRYHFLIKQLTFKTKYCSCGRARDNHTEKVEQLAGKIYSCALLAFTTAHDLAIAFFPRLGSSSIRMTLKHLPSTDGPPAAVNVIGNRVFCVTLLSLTCRQRCVLRRGLYAGSSTVAW